MIDWILVNLINYFIMEIILGVDKYKEKFIIIKLKIFCKDFNYAFLLALDFKITQ